MRALVLASVYFLAQFVQTFNFMVDDLLMSKIVGHKSLDDVYTVSDFYSWFRLGFVPVVLGDSFGYL